MTYGIDPGSWFDGCSHKEKEREGERDRERETEREREREKIKLFNYTANTIFLSLTRDFMVWSMFGRSS